MFSKIHAPLTLSGASFDGVATVPVAHGGAFSLHGFDVLSLALTPSW